MINILRADMYRILRGKGIYITLAVLLLMNALVVGPGVVGGINFGNTHGDLGIEAPTLYFDGVNVVTVLYTRMDNIVFFLLPLIIIVAGAMFTDKTVRNDISWGVSRTKLYLSKLALSAVMCVALIVFYMASGMLMAIIVRGFGGPAPAGHWQNLFQTVGAQLFIMLGVTSLGVFMALTFKCTSAVVGVYCAFWFVPIMIITVLSETIDPGFVRLLDFDLMFSINRLGFFSQLETRVILTALGVGAFYIVVATVGGIALFKRAEIK